MPKWNAVPQHRIGIPRRDVRNLALILKDFAHRQGGCYYHDGSTRHRITLPEPAMRQVLELNRANYSQWTVKQRTAVSALSDNGLHQIDLYLTNGDPNDMVCRDCGTHISDPTPTGNLVRDTN